MEKRWENSDKQRKFRAYLNSKRGGKQPAEVSHAARGFARIWPRRSRVQRCWCGASSLFKTWTCDIWKNPEIFHRIGPFEGSTDETFCVWDFAAFRGFEWRRTHIKWWSRREIQEIGMMFTVHLNTRGRTFVYPAISGRIHERSHWGVIYTLFLGSSPDKMGILCFGD